MLRLGRPVECIGLVHASLPTVKMCISPALSRNTIFGSHSLLLALRYIFFCPYLPIILSLGGVAVYMFH